MSALVMFLVCFLGIFLIAKFLLPEEQGEKLLSGKASKRKRVPALPDSNQSILKGILILLAGVILWNHSGAIPDQPAPFPPPPNPNDPFISFSGQMFTWISPGEFIMGSPSNEAGRKENEGPQKTLLFSQGFWMAVTETTQDQYAGITGKNSDLIFEINRPVTQVSWQEAIEFCRTLTKIAQERERIPSNWAYCLPTEAQWEFACRSGSNKSFSRGEELFERDAIFQVPQGGKGRKGWRRHPSPKQVASTRPNDWGLYDMHGNVAEWCLDAKYRYAYTTLYCRNGFESLGSGGQRAIRGGHYRSLPKKCRSAARDWEWKHTKWPTVGFRCTLGPIPPGGFPEGRFGTMKLWWGLVLLLPFIWGIARSFSGRARQLNRTFGRFAHLYKGKLQPAQAMTYPEVDFAYRGFQTKLNFFSAEGDKSKLYTCLTIDLYNAFSKAHIRLEVAPQFMTSFRATRFKGLTEWVPTKADSPLRTLLIQTDDQDGLQKLLVSGLEKLIVKVNHMGSLAPAYICLNPGKLVIKKLQTLTSMGSLQAFTAVGFQFVDLLVRYYGIRLETSEFLLIEKDNEAKIEIPICGICGANILQDAVTCDRCDTPHHLDCWEYNELCSTFACGCKSYHSKPTA